MNGQTNIYSVTVLNHCVSYVVKPWCWSKDGMLSSITRPNTDPLRKYIHRNLMRVRAKPAWEWHLHHSNQDSSYCQAISLTRKGRTKECEKKIKGKGAAQSSICTFLLKRHFLINLIQKIQSYFFYLKCSFKLCLFYFTSNVGHYCVHCVRKGRKKKICEEKTDCSKLCLHFF